MHQLSVISALHRGEPLAAVIPATLSGRLAWAGVYPLDLTRDSTQRFLQRRGVTPPPLAEHAYHIRTFEVDRELIDQDACIAEPDLNNKNSYIVFGDEELKTQLQRIGVVLDQLDLHYRSGYPI